MDNPPKRVFLSHTGELRTYPSDRSFVAAAEAAVLACGHSVVDMEYFTARDDKPAKYCEQRVEASDVYVGLIGFRYGTPVRDQPDLSHTQLEYRIATQRGMPRLLFLLDEEATGLPAKALRDLTYGARQESFRDELSSSDVMLASFDSPERLERLVYQALIELESHPASASGSPSQIPVFMAPKPPPGFVPRPDIADELLRHLSSPTEVPMVALSTALRGAGGFGKTTLAEWACHQQTVRELFPDGILWVTLGDNRSASEIVSLIGDLSYHLSGERPALSDPQQAGAHLGRLLAQRRILIVIDDVWRAQDVEPFLLGGPRCMRLITTRNLDIVPAEAAAVHVDAMTNVEAGLLLRAGLPDPAPGVLDGLLSISGRWPLLLTLLNGILREELAGGATLIESAVRAEEALRQHGPSALDVADPSQRSLAVAATLRLSFAALQRSYGAAGTDALDRYLQLGVFPEDTPIPLSVLALWWGTSEGWSDHEVRAFSRTLVRLSLVQRFDTAASTLYLHDVIADYLRHLISPDLPALNDSLLDAHSTRLGKNPEAWWRLPEGDHYMWTHIAFHLINAERESDLRLIVGDARFIIAKTFRLGPAAVEADLRVALRYTDSGSPLVALERAFRQAGHLFTGFDRETDLAAVLLSRLPTEGLLGASVEPAGATLERPFLLPLAALPDLADPGLMRTISAHPCPVEAVAIGERGTLVVTGGADGTIHVWEAATGKRRSSLRGHVGAVSDVGLDATEAHLVSSGHDGTVRLWSWATGEESFCASEHDWSSAVGLDASTGRIISSGFDGAVVEREVVSGREVLKVNARDEWASAVAVDARTRRVAFGSPDGTLHVIDVDSDDRQNFAGHEGPVNALAFSPSGTFVASGGLDGVAHLWSLTTGLHVTRFWGHDGPVNAVTFDAAGDVVSAGTDGTIRLWDPDTGRQFARFTGHDGPVQALALDPSHHSMVSGGVDGTARVWDLWARSGGRDVHARSLSAALDPSAQHVLFGASDGYVRVRNLRSGSQMQLRGHHGPVNAVAFEGVLGQQAVSGGSDGTVRIWDAHTGRHVSTLKGHAGPVNAVTFVRGRAQPGDRVVSAGSDGEVILWDAINWLPTRLGAHESAVNAVAYDPSTGRALSGGSDSTVREWDLGRSEAGVVFEMEGRVTSLAISMSGNLLATGSSDGAVRVWDMRSGRCVSSFWGHNGSVSAVAFVDQRGRPDGRILSGGLDGTVRVWSLETAGELTRVRIDGRVLACSCGSIRLPDREATIVALGGTRGQYVLEILA